MCRSGPTIQPVCRISASGTARSTPASATPISIRRLGTSSRACWASPTIHQPVHPISERRRHAFRYLCRHYGGRLGPERLAVDTTRGLLISLITVTLALETQPAVGRGATNNGDKFPSLHGALETEDYTLPHPLIRGLFI